MSLEPAHCGCAASNRESGGWAIRVAEPLRSKLSNYERIKRALKSVKIVTL